MQKLALYLILQICLFYLLHISSECYYYPCSCSNWKHGSYLRLLSCGSISKNSNNDINVTTIYSLLILCQYCAKCFVLSSHNSGRLIRLLFFSYRWQNRICPLILPPLNYYLNLCVFPFLLQSFKFSRFCVPWTMEVVFQHVVLYRILWCLIPFFTLELEYSM